MPSSQAGSRTVETPEASVIVQVFVSSPSMPSIAGVKVKMSPAKPMDGETESETAACPGWYS